MVVVDLGCIVISLGAGLDHLYLLYYYYHHQSAPAQRYITICDNKCETTISRGGPKHPSRRCSSAAALGALLVQVLLRDCSGAFRKTPCKAVKLHFDHLELGIWGL
jgi:hypothetical protein